MSTQRTVEEWIACFARMANHGHDSMFRHSVSIFPWRDGRDGLPQWTVQFEFAGETVRGEGSTMLAACEAAARAAARMPRDKRDVEERAISRYLGEVATTEPPPAPPILRSSTPALPPPSVSPPPPEPLQVIARELETIRHLMERVVDYEPSTSTERRK